jgi:hypothetical protein
MLVLELGMYVQSWTFPLVDVMSVYYRIFILCSSW